MPKDKDIIPKSEKKKEKEQNEEQNLREINNNHIDNSNNGYGNNSNSNSIYKNNSNNNKNSKVSQEQLYDMLISREVGWQAIIFDLIKTEQLNPWDIDLVLLARKYIEKIKEIQEQEGMFFISSKILLAATLLLRIKSEILHNNIKSIDEILFDKPNANADNTIDTTNQINQIIDFKEEELPEILPRTPLPRSRKVTLNELITALDKAINTEHRRIKKEINFRHIRSEVSIVLPKKGIDIKKRIKDLYNKIKDFFNKKKEKLTYTYLVGTERDERIACFLPLLHLNSQEKIKLEQEKPFEEINILLKNITN